MIPPQFLKKVAPKMPMEDSKADKLMDKKSGIKEGSKADSATEKGTTKKAGEGMIGKLARRVGAAPGQPSYRGGK